ncbi:cupin domain-containing protein [Rubrobacter indicoceani]|uniref:cupin domain-containing protein n=1 Tax=Rubrobacter indicoceani TaxID=2051957 RepID=UPI000E5AD12E|nr:cupin domain-containing protein [Rubrobacter indicoceani]
MADHPRVVNGRDVPPSEMSHGERFGYKRRSLSAATGAENLGCSLYEIPPGKQAWPRHYHLANEEAIYVMEGSGTLTIGDTKTAVSPGDYAHFEASESAVHSLFNDSETPLVYLCFSTMNVPDVMVYPDSEKVGVFGGAAPGGAKEKRTFSRFLSTKKEVGYFDDEE